MDNQFILATLRGWIDTYGEKDGYMKRISIKNISRINEKNVEEVCNYIGLSTNKDGEVFSILTFWSTDAYTNACNFNALDIHTKNAICNQLIAQLSSDSNKITVNLSSPHMYALTCEIEDRNNKDKQTLAVSENIDRISCEMKKWVDIDSENISRENFDSDEEYQEELWDEDKNFDVLYATPTDVLLVHRMREDLFVKYEIRPAGTLI